VQKLSENGKRAQVDPTMIKSARQNHTWGPGGKKAKQKERITENRVREAMTFQRKNRWYAEENYLKDETMPQLH